MSRSSKVAADNLNGNEEKLDRWRHLMNSDENASNLIVKILAEVEENLMNRIDHLHSSLEKLITTKDDEFYKSDILAELKKIGIKLPMKSLSTFVRLDEELRSDTRKRHALKCHMVKLIDAGNSLTKDIAKILRRLMTTDVDRHYSGYGRMHKGKRKLNFSETNVYLCMQDVLTDKYKKSANQLNILTCVSRWLAQYRDRLPGAGPRRPSRRRKRLELSASNESSSSSSE